MRPVRFQALFDDAAAARRAVARLIEAGVSPEAIELRSAAPEPALPGGGAPSRIGLAAVAGGLFGGLSGFLVAALTALDRPLLTGGMPLVAPLPVGIITYEATALGAILAAVARTLYEARLWPRTDTRAGALDGDLAGGAILLEAAVAEAQVGERSLSEAVRVAVVSSGP